MEQECKLFLHVALPCLLLMAAKLLFRYNGTSDLQLERMNVYFNEVNVSRGEYCVRKLT